MAIEPLSLLSRIRGYTMLVLREANPVEFETGFTPTLILLFKVAPLFLKTPIVRLTSPAPVCPWIS
jgi:hypothetical protein